MSNDLSYLAAPYTHKEHYMMVARFLAINQVAAKLMSEGNYIFSPISHTHPIAEAGTNGRPLPRGWEFWSGYDHVMIRACKRIIVLKLPGWEESTGVQAEIHIGIKMGLNIEYIDYDLTPTYKEIIEYAKSLEPSAITKIVSYNHEGQTCFYD